MAGKDDPQEESLQFVLLLLLQTLKHRAGFRWAHSVSSVCEASPFTSLHLLRESRRFGGRAALKTLAEESRHALVSIVTHVGAQAQGQVSALSQQAPWKDAAGLRVVR